MSSRFTVDYMRFTRLLLLPLFVCKPLGIEWREQAGPLDDIDAQCEFFGAIPEIVEVIQAIVISRYRKIEIVSLRLDEDGCPTANWNFPIKESTCAQIRIALIRISETDLMKKFLQLFRISLMEEIGGDPTDACNQVTAGNVVIEQDEDTTEFHCNGHMAFELWDPVGFCVEHFETSAAVDEICNDLRLLADMFNQYL